MVIQLFSISWTIAWLGNISDKYYELKHEESSMQSLQLLKGVKYEEMGIVPDLSIQDVCP